MKVAQASACARFSLCAALIFLAVPCAASAQSNQQSQQPAWFTTGTNMGTAKYRVAVPDFAGANPSSQPLGKQFSDIVRADLDFSGIIDLVSPSMYPLQVPAQPSEFQAQAWADAPASAQFLGFGNINASGNTLAIQAWLNDVKNTSAPPMIAKIYRGEVT